MEADLKSLQQKIQDLENKLSFTHTELELNDQVADIKINKPNKEKKSIEINMFTKLKKNDD